MTLQLPCQDLVNLAKIRARNNTIRDAIQWITGSNGQVEDLRQLTGRRVEIQVLHSHIGPEVLDLLK